MKFLKTPFPSRINWGREPIANVIYYESNGAKQYVFKKGTLTNAKRGERGVEHVRVNVLLPHRGWNKYDE